MYIDPSAGSMILQVVFAGALAAAAAFGRVRKAVADFLFRSLRRLRGS
jgi:hypothetical protein